LLLVAASLFTGSLQCISVQAQWSTQSSTNNIYYNSGTVGIGTATPTFSLDVVTSAGTVARFKSTAAANSVNITVDSASTWNSNIEFQQNATNKWYLGNIASDNRFRFTHSAANGNVEVFTILQGGNVGIGTTSPATSLHVAASSSDTITRVAQFYQPGLSTTNNYSFISVGKANAADQAAAFGFLMNSLGNDSAFMTVAGDDPAAGTGLFVRKGGNVGIGTTSPAGLLHVNGNVVLGPSTTGPAMSMTNPDNLASFAQLSFYPNAGTNSGSALSIVPRGSGYTTVIKAQISVFNTDYNADATNYEFATLRAAGTTFNLTTGKSGTGTIRPMMLSAGYGDGATNPNQVYLATSGNVGIGSSSPGSKLEVAGNIGVTGTGNITAAGTITGGNIVAKYQDVAEWVPSSEQVTPGTVVVLDTTKSNQVISSNQAYDTRVAGVVSERPGLELGESGAGKVLVATTGRVLVKVDAGCGSIHIGDLLVTRDSPSVAMKSEPVQVGKRMMHLPGTLIGKALEPLEKGSGKILVLLSLQ
jgi:hypothetical protein